MISEVVSGMSMAKSIIIIGAGIAGLSAGCYGQMNGYQTQIFEMHDKPGGVCTAWERKGYTIDGCLHWVVGSSPDSSYYFLWKELGTIQGCKFIDFEEFRRIEGADGKTWTIYSDLDRLEEHTKEIAPEDAKVIHEFISGARAMSRLNFKWKLVKAPELTTILDNLKIMPPMLSFMPTFLKFRRVSTGQYAQRFKNPFLRRAFTASFAGEFADFSMLARQGTLGFQHSKQAGWPIGGSLEFVRTIEKRYLELGGQVHYRSPVNKILVENNRAIGVRLFDRTEYRSDIVISAADGHSTIFGMLDGKFMNDKLKEYYAKLPLFPPLLYVGLGIARSFPPEPHEIVYILEKPFTFGNKTCDRMCLDIYNYDPTFAPPGKTSLVMLLYADYDYWQKLRLEDREQYKQEKEKIADQVIAFLDTRFPGLAKQVEMRDVATPATWERYTGNWRGSWEGWFLSSKVFMTSMSKELPGLKNFYMIGQWVEPGGGTPAAAVSGRNAIQIICKRDGRKFTTTKP
jgi:phytoene dehydrogenase-like protein